MKTAACFAVCMAMAISLSAHSFTSPDFVKCRDYAADWGKNFTTIQMIGHDLVNGNWTTGTAEGEGQAYFFTEGGLLLIFETDAFGYKFFRSTFWRVAEMDNQPLLLLSDGHCNEKRMHIAQTCEGITLRDVVKNEVLLLEYQPFKALPKLNGAHAFMVGEWTNVTAFETTEKHSTPMGGYLNYRFSADGMFTCEFGNHTEKVSEKGSWEISKDGQFLILHLSKNNELEMTKATEVIRIVQVDDHGLVLEQVMKTNRVNEFFAASNKTFAFIK